MFQIKTINLDYKVEPGDFHNKDNITQQCYGKLENTIYNDFYIDKIIELNLSTKNKINIDGSVVVRINCTCNIINPEVSSSFFIKIHSISKMGYTHKHNKVCIFIPIHLCSDSYEIGDEIFVEIIGKRIEDTITCIGKPVLSKN